MLYVKPFYIIARAGVQLRRSRLAGMRIGKMSILLDHTYDRNVFT